MDFDLAPQALQSAIDRYSDITGMSVVYLGTLVVGRRSAEVKGRYTPEVALRMLLGVQGLVVKRTTPKAFVLMQADTPMVQSHDKTPAPATAADRRYYGEVQSRIVATLCADTRLAMQRFRAALQLWLDNAGGVADLRLLDTTGDAQRDRDLLQALRLARFQAPPAGFAQPLTLLLLPNDRQCHAG